MITPDKVQIEAERREDENYKFRTFLKYMLMRRNWIISF